MDRKYRVRALAVLVGLTLPAKAFAHGGEIHEGQSFWSLWHWSPEIIAALLLAAIVYGRGAMRGQQPSAWRIAAFAGGLVALFLALVSPIERLADHIFAVHQVEHMLLRTMGPMLIFLAGPQAVLMRGLPAGMKRRLAGPIMTNGGVRGFFSFLTTPVIATSLFVGVSYFWMYPSWHDLAILNEPIHYGWHTSLLITGLLFFSVMFDPRPVPAGAGLPTRLAMFVVAALGNIVLGAFLTFKTVPLYSAYEISGHMWHVSTLTDEQTGGIIMWIPGCMMFALSAIIILYRWGQDEERAVARRRRDGRALQSARDGGNRIFAMSLAAFSVIILMLAIAIVSLIDGGYAGASHFAHHADRHSGFNG
ncbi:cytochrome c oxidase assembly protein [Rhizorhapis sp. SPR117]|uniref:cytochrome c oxidase assembly protein n=1 Tax=Rhizorhapis sp. SPR117 TaxID=2912611 RepID=UPI001F2C0625|nr:cytochrome c oxidase assembly protein [Rhizorhapis sp. SPR117]